MKCRTPWSTLSFREKSNHAEARNRGLYNDTMTKGHTVTESELRDMAEDVAGAIADYPNQDPAEVMDEVIRIIAEQEELTAGEVDRLRRYSVELAR